MNKLWQIFVAPGDDNEKLPIEPSPWHDDRDVSIPRGHWELIMDYAKSVDPELGKKLDIYSFSDDENDFYVDCNHQELEQIIPLLKRLSNLIQSSESIHPEATEELPDVYENCEYVRMLEAVNAVFQEAVKYNMPFQAWIE